MKLNIRQRVRLIALSGAVLSFFGLGCILLIGMMTAGEKAAERGRLLGDSAVAFVEDFSGEQTRKLLAAHVSEKARQVEAELNFTRRNVESLADAMSLILSAPDRYRFRSLLDPHTDTVASGVTYLNYSRKLAAEGVGEALRQEMGIAGNISDFLAPLSRYYTGVFVGSRNGWLIAADTRPDAGDVQFSEKFLANYDPRETVWYKLGAKTKRGDPPLFTELYIDSNGVRCITCAAPFYDAAGFAGVAGVDCNAEYIYRHVLDEEKRRATFVLNQKGEILFSTEKKGLLAVGDAPRDLRHCTEEDLAFEAASMAAGKNDVVLVELSGEEYYLAYAPMPSVGWSVGTIVEKNEVVYPARYARDILAAQMKDFTDDLFGLFLQVAKSGGLMLLLLLGLILYLGTKVSDHFVRPILSLTEGVKEIAHGNLDKQLSIKTGDEIERLADCVNAMESDLKAYMENLSKVTAEKERIATELSVAQRIQSGMMPSLNSGFSGQREFDMDAVMLPAKEVGGDFYDYYRLDEDHLAVTVADVSGKGVPAALFMVVAKTVLENFAKSAELPCDFADVVAQANDRLCEGNEQMMFVTVVFGVLDLRTGEFVYVNAGHNPPLLARGGDEFSHLASEGKADKPLGLVEGLRFRQNSLTLAPGDMLFFYTDGVVETANEAEELYGEARLLAELARRKNEGPVKDILAAVGASLREFAGTAEQTDDITMLGLRYLGK